jgi:hypothetical protein
MTIHSGVEKQHIPFVDQRVLGVVSRGGSIMVQWMRQHQKESFLYEHFDDILRLANQYDITMSLGDGFRPAARPKPAMRRNTVNWKRLESWSGAARKPMSRSWWRGRGMFRFIGLKKTSENRKKFATARLFTFWARWSSITRRDTIISRERSAAHWRHFSEQTFFAT